MASGFEDMRVQGVCLTATTPLLVFEESLEPNATATGTSRVTQKKYFHLPVPSQMLQKGSRQGEPWSMGQEGGRL